MCNSNNTNQITDISTLQVIHKLHNYMHIIISMQSHGHTIRFQFWPDMRAYMYLHAVPAGFQKFISGKFLIVTGSRVKADDLVACS